MVLTIKQQSSWAAIELNILLFITLSFDSFAQPASLESKEAFGSEPYKLIESYNNYIAATGKSATGSNDGSPIVDLLTYENNTFSLIDSYDFNQQFINKYNISVEEVVSYEGRFMFLVSVNQELYLSSMQIKQNKLFLEASLYLGNGNKFSNLVKGNSNNFYVINTNYGSNIRVN